MLLLLLLVVVVMSVVSMTAMEHPPLVPSMASSVTPIPVVPPPAVPTPASAVLGPLRRVRGLLRPHMPPNLRRNPKG